MDVSIMVLVFKQHLNGLHLKYVSILIIQLYTYVALLSDKDAIKIF